MAPPLARAESPRLPTHARHARVPCCVYYVAGSYQACQRPDLRHCWGSRAPLSGASSPHLVCDQHFTVYKALSPPLTDTSASNTGELGLVIPKFKTRYLVSENEEPSSPKAQGRGWEARSCLGSCPHASSTQSLSLLPKLSSPLRDPYLVLKNNRKASMNQLLFLSFFLHLQ